MSESVSQLTYQGSTHIFSRTPHGAYIARRKRETLSEAAARYVDTGWPDEAPRAAFSGVGGQEPSSTPSADRGRKSPPSICSNCGCSLLAHGPRGCEARAEDDATYTCSCRRVAS